MDIFLFFLFGVGLVFVVRAIVNIFGGNSSENPSLHKSFSAGDMLDPDNYHYWEQLRGSPDDD